MIRLVDLDKNYNADTITCFERPIVIIMKNYRKSLEWYMIMLIKLNGIYTGKKPEKEQLFREIENIFGCKIFAEKYNYGRISRLVSANIPVVCGMNLYDVFLNFNYKKNSWPHWTIVENVDYDNKILQLFDNFQFSDLSHKFEEINFIPKLLKRANKSFIRSYGVNYSCYYIDKNNIEDDEVILKKLIKKYLDIDEKNSTSYKQVQIFELLNKYIREVNDELYIEELKKKLVNTNKYREVFFEIIMDILRQYHYSSDDIEKLEQDIRNLDKCWYSYIMLETVRCINTADYCAVVPDEIIEKESLIKNQIKKFYDTMLTKNIEYSDVRRKSEFVSENNDENIISKVNDTYTFEFSGNRTYNWWNNCDFSPKVILEKNFEIKSGMVVEFEIDIESNCTIENFQIGFFVRDRYKKYAYMGGIENNKYLALDKVGVTGLKKIILSEEHYNVYYKIEENIITAAIKESNGGEEIIFMDFECIDEADIGISCKTWGKGGELKISISNVKII